MFCSWTSLPKGDIYVPIPGPGRKVKVSGWLQPQQLPCPAVAAVRKRGQSCPDSTSGHRSVLQKHPWCSFLHPTHLVWGVSFVCCDFCVCCPPWAPMLRGYKLYQLKHPCPRWVVILWKLETAKKQNPCGLRTALHASTKWESMHLNFFLYSTATWVIPGKVCYAVILTFTLLTFPKAWHTKNG